MKKVVSFLLTLCLCVSAAPLGVFNLTASAATRGLFVYKLVDGEAVITDIDENVYEVTHPCEFVIVPGSFLDKDIDVVGGIADKAFSGCEKLQSITLYENMKKVGKDAFLNCPKLETVVVFNPECEFVNGSGLNSNQTIYGFKGSTAETLAKSIGAKFVEVKEVHSHIYDGEICGEPTACIKCGAKGWLKQHGFFECYGTCSDCGAYVREDQHGYFATVKKATFKKNGSIYKHCAWCPKEIKTTVKRVKTVKLLTTTYTYNGKVKKPSVTVKDSAGKKLKNGEDYKVSYAKGRKNVGTYKVTVTLKGNYEGKKVLTFKIKPRKTKVSKITAGKKKLTVSVSKEKTQISGYQIELSSSKKFKSAKKITLKGYKSAKYTFKGLKSKKTYYIRVRTYKTVDGKKYYSSWSSYKYKKTK